MSNSRNLVHAATAIAVTLHLLSGCAGTSHPIIDTKGADMDQYRVDLAECEAFADEVDIAGGMVRSGAGAGLEEARNKQSVVKECLRGRGYRVLN